jgi:N-acetylneuraminate synthase
MTLGLTDREFYIDDPGSPWSGYTLHQLYDKAHTPWEWHELIFERARERGMFAFSAPFDETAVDFLESLNVPCYKIASFENTDLPLIRRIGATGKPVIISTGLASVGELDEAVQTARQSGCPQVLLLKCTSAYPANPADANLSTIPHMRSLFGCEVGLSDHTLGVGTAIAAVALGASIVEKHLTINRDDGGVDSAFSLEPCEFARLVEETKLAWQVVGGVSYGPTASEASAVLQRRSIYVAADMKAGDVFTAATLRCIRPGLGLQPRHLPTLLGRRAAQAIEMGTPMRWDLAE